MAEMIPFEGKNKDDSLSSNEPDQKPSQERANATRPVYTNEEVSEIIRVALRGVESGDNTVDYDEMLSIGRDFGLTERDLKGAFESINQARSEQELSSKAALFFKIHAMCFVVIMLALFVLNWITVPGYWWSGFPLLGWGTALALHGGLTRYFPSYAAAMFETVPNESLEWTESNTRSNSIPSAAAFTTPDVYNGFACASGVAQIQDDELIIEFEIKDAFLGIIKSGVKEIRVPLRDIASVRLTRVIWSTKLLLQSHRLKTFEDFPGHSGGKILLVFNREARAASERLAAELSKRIAQP